MRGHAIVLWIVAPFLLWLSLYRPFTDTTGRASDLPAQIGPFVQFETYAISAEYARQLGTDDATWRGYRGPDGKEVYVIAVFHGANWKSVHPPHICLRGANMDITADELIDVEFDGTAISIGKIKTWSRDRKKPLMSVYAYVAPGLVTGSFMRFFLFHAPLALIRQSVGGCLIRVETWIDEGPDGERYAENRCRAFLAEFLKVTEDLRR